MLNYFFFQGCTAAQDPNHVVVQIVKHQAFKQLIFYMNIIKAVFSQCSLAGSYVQT